MKPKPYNPSACCGADCMYYDPDNPTCEGDVEVVDEIELGDDYGWLHACEKHSNSYGVPKK